MWEASFFLKCLAHNPAHSHLKAKSEANLTINTPNRKSRVEVWREKRWSLIHLRALRLRKPRPSLCNTQATLSSIFCSCHTNHPKGYVYHVKCFDIIYHINRHSQWLSGAGFSVISTLQKKKEISDRCMACQRSTPGKSQSQKCKQVF